MNGFVLQFANVGAPNNGAAIMQCFAPQNVPAITTLATSFAVCDRWFASIPGPTQPNRMYAHSATSHGAATNDDLQILEGYPQETIYDSLYNAGMYASRNVLAMLLCCLVQLLLLLLLLLFLMCRNVAGHSFKIYYSDFPATLIMRTLRQKKYIHNINQIRQFYGMSYCCVRKSIANDCYSDVQSTITLLLLLLLLLLLSQQ
jgi:hypothetical protein